MGDSVRTIPLTKGLFAIVDDEDYQALSLHKWSATDCGNMTYALREENGRRIYMHRTILSPPPGSETDHVNMNGLDNRKCNLRVATRSQNNGNHARRRDSKSPYKGLHWDAVNLRWRATIREGGKAKHLGRFSDPVEAALAYDLAALRVFGEFARPNFLRYQATD